MVRLIFPRDHNTFLNGRMLIQQHLDLFRLDAEATKFYLVIDAPKEVTRLR